MSLPSFATQTVTRLRATRTTDHGTDVDDWTSPDRLDIPGCIVEPRPGAEDLQHRDSTTTVWVVYAPADADVLDTDRVEWAGVAYEIDGPVQTWDTGVLDHLEIALKNVGG